MTMPKSILIGLHSGVCSFDDTAGGHLYICPYECSTYECSVVDTVYCTYSFS